MMVDSRRRAERRRDYYEKIKADPNQFLQIHGRSIKIHLDPSIALAADSPANMMPWPGDSKILIDRQIWKWDFILKIFDLAKCLLVAKYQNKIRDLLAVLPLYLAQRSDSGFQPITLLLFGHTSVD